MRDRRDLSSPRRKVCGGSFTGITTHARKGERWMAASVPPFYGKPIVLFHFHQFIGRNARPSAVPARIRFAPWRHTNSVSPRSHRLPRTVVPSFPAESPRRSPAVVTLRTGRHNHPAMDDESGASPRLASRRPSSGAAPGRWRRDARRHDARQRLFADGAIGVLHTRAGPARREARGPGPACCWQC